MSASASGPAYAFAGDREIAVRVLDWLLARGERPAALLVSDPTRASHADELRARCDFLPDERVLVGGAFREPAGIDLLRTLGLDWVIGIHFPYIVPAGVLALPRHGVLNLHPALLPWNRGWHTPSWAILEGTPAGATLHFMDEGVDTGDVVHQKRIDPRPDDTAHTLYLRTMDLELDVFREAWPSIVDGSWTRTPQSGEGSAHARRELLADEVRRIDLDEPMPPRALLDRLRALTTNDPAEAAWFEVDGRRFGVRVEIRPIEQEDSRR